MSWRVGLLVGIFVRFIGRPAFVWVAASACVAGLLPLLVIAPARADVTTVSSDLLRTAWDSNEPGLSPSSVQSSDFGQLFNTTVDGSVYAQPLVSGTTLLVTTEKAKAYAINTRSGAVLWSRTDLGSPFQATTVNCGDLTPDLGSTSTGVVDPSTGTFYFTTKTVSGSDGLSGTWKLQAVSIATGQDRSGFPKTIQGSPANDPTHPFTPTTVLQRPGLLLLGGVVYLAFGAHCDRKPFKGYVVGVDAATGNITSFWTSAVGGSNGAGIWQSGGGLMSDGPGRIFLSTGNGFFGATPSGTPGLLGESVVRLKVNADRSLTTDDWFTPSNAPTLDANDTDLGSGAPTGLPTGFGTPAHPNLLVQIGKDGRLFVLDRDHLGGYAGPSGTDDVVSVTSNVGGTWGHPAFFGGGGGYLYVTPSYKNLTAFAYGVDAGGVPHFTAVGTSTAKFQFSSGSPVVTSDGTDPSSATVWQIYSNGPAGGSGSLRAYSAIPVNGVMQQVWQQPVGIVSKFSMPATDGGSVYVGTRDGHVFGFGRPQAAALTFSPLEFGQVPVSGSSPMSVTLTATKALTVSTIAAAPPFAATPGTLPKSLASGATLTVPVAFSPTTPGDATGQLTVQTSAGKYLVGLHGMGTAKALIASPTTIAFGDQPTKLPATANVVIQNTGTATASITAVSALSAPFALIGGAGSSIAPGASVTLGVSFTPTVVGSVSSSLTITSTGGNVTIPITGTGVQGISKLVLSPTTVAFGNVVVGRSATGTFTVSNAGNLPLTITKAKAPTGVFSTSSPLGEGLVVNEDPYTQQVTFTPPKLGAFTGTYAVFGDDGRGQQTVTLTGTGIAPPLPTILATVRPVIVRAFPSSPYSVGKLLRASKGVWRVAPTSYAYLWFRNGRSIPKADHTWYIPVNGDRGLGISVRVTAYRAGYRPTAATSRTVHIR